MVGPLTYFVSDVSFTNATVKIVSQLSACNFFMNTSFTGAIYFISTGPITSMLLYVFNPFFWAATAKASSKCDRIFILSVNAIIKTLLTGSAGSFSLFTQELVVLIDGLQELIVRDKVSVSTAETNFALSIIRF